MRPCSDSTSASFEPEPKPYISTCKKNIVIDLICNPTMANYFSDAVSIAADPGGGGATPPRGRHEEDTRVPGR